MLRPTDPAQILEHEINDLPYEKKPEKLTKKSLKKIIVERERELKDLSNFSRDKLKLTKVKMPYSYAGS